MLLPAFDFQDPVSLPEACALLARLGPAASPIAGGTDLLVNMKKKLAAPRHLVSLAGIPELTVLDSTNGTLTIGACCSVADLAASDLVASAASALRAAAMALGTPLVRNRATIGGNIASARPAADLPPALIGYGASVVLASTAGTRKIALDAFFSGPGQTVRQPDEIISAVALPIPGPNAGAGYLNLGVRQAQDCNIVNVAAFIALAGDGRIESARVVMGSVGPTPIRAPSAEKQLLGEMPGDSLFAKAGEAACADSRPIIDFRGSAEYRRAMAGVLTRRALQIAFDEICSRNP